MTPNRSTPQNGSILGGAANNSLIGPHKVSATIISILSKNPYEANMDAIDQIQTWESQALSLSVPIEYFLSYMEVLLSKEVLCWWQVQRPIVRTWEHFKKQFIEDFGDQNRIIKAERELANLTQGENESFQQLLLRFTRLMNHIAPAKPESAQLYILMAALRKELRASCASARTMAELKRLCLSAEGMEKARVSSVNAHKVNMVSDSNNNAITKDYWNEEIELQQITEETDRVLVIDEMLNNKKMAMSQGWTKEQRLKWLNEQVCWNCERKGHLQSQCDENWVQHCARCGNKQVKGSKDCPKCLGKDPPLRTNL